MASYQNGSSATNGSEKTNGSKLPARSSSSHGERLASQAKPKPAPLKLKQTKANREGVTNAFERYGQVIHAAVEPLPVQGGAGTFSENKKWTKLRTDLKNLRVADYKTLKTMVLSKLRGEQWSDDKTMIMESVIQLVANLPSHSKTRAQLTDSFITQLWDSLEHPPSLFVGDKYQYRQADGSYNNVMYPQLGAAGTAYARSVNTSVLRPGALPDPALIYDAVMKRVEYKKHPNNVSSVLWYWASIIIHDLFWTDYRDMNKSKTSSYLDLSPLYGSNQEMQDTIRTFEAGKLKPDCFADKRLLGMPPGVGVLLIMFNRFHNHVAENLAAINEDGKFTPPAASLEGDQAAAAWKKHDNDLFQTARLVTSGLYINITLVDYVRNIVNLNRVDTDWTLDPRQASGIDVGTKKGSARGTGNVVSAEFNLCYRWHSCVSEKDDKWIEEFYHDLFKKPAADVTVPELIMGFAKFEKMIPEDPAERPFGKFKRGADGKFSDDDLAECMASAVEDCAGSFGARNVPASMRAIEILGIIQGRKWNVSGLNEFRKHFGLKPYETFEDINSDPVVSGSLRRLYDHPDFVELYPGLVAEEHKPPKVPGVGIAPTYTISRVVLSDAVCLVRGDRHYTTDYGPRNLTNWGYNEAQYDLNINHGCVFYKLFIRALPSHFKSNSVYAHYPMVIPSETEKIQKDLERADLFDYSRPARSTQLTEVASYSGGKYVLESQDKYRPTWHESLVSLVGGAAKLSGDSAHHDSQRRAVQQQLSAIDWLSQVKALYAQTTERLLVASSYNVAGHRLIDVVRDVGNIAPVHFASRVFGLPLRTPENPKGIYTEHELYAVLAVVVEALFYNSDPVKAFPINQAAKTVAVQLATVIERTVKSPKAKKTDALATYGASLVKGLAKAGLSNEDIAWSQILPTAAALVPTQAELFALAVDYYLSPAGATHLAEIHAVATQPASDATDALLLGFALEGVRLSGVARSSCVYEAAAADTIEDDGSEISVHAKDRVAVSFVEAARDPAHFPDPTTVNPRRPVDKHLHHAAGPHTFLGRDASHAALTEMFRALFRRKNVRRAPGPQGELKKVPSQAGGDGEVSYLRDDWGALTPFPVTMKVTWDEE
ncbi:heme peroxidase [Lasiosphaeria miniovina]|uniref:Heme peroxidase n=1 Tax=Lasiosphaeria miniovina TaxID=1954250 RepID=A0AA40ADV5_9PEZI|nr:heme peroxidase [Lasiosphaeria miniovina]KAK0714040.1 heme peroxidase [Lasiosphaeria miniovina]